MVTSNPLLKREASFGATAESAVSRKWIAQHLAMGSWTHVSNLLGARRKQESLKRWHLHGWLGRYRRLNRSYERRTEVAEAMVYLAMSRLMLSRWVKH